jgi:hypothetical protein
MFAGASPASGRLFVSLAPPSCGEPGAGISECGSDLLPPLHAQTSTFSKIDTAHTRKNRTL